MWFSLLSPRLSSQAPSSSDDFEKELIKVITSGSGWKTYSLIFFVAVKCVLAVMGDGRKEACFPFGLVYLNLITSRAFILHNPKGFTTQQ